MTDNENHKSYNSFDANGYHFIVLDANFDQLGEDHFYLEGADWQNTNIPTDQLNWLEKDLTSMDYPTIVFCHHPLYCYERDGFVFHISNYTEVQAALEDSKKAIGISGPRARTKYCAEINGIHYVTLLGMVDFEGLENNAFTKVSVSNNRSEITGFARSQSASVDV
ncbi:MAG: hypothetical protein WBG48_17990 [Pricia sp.]